MPNDDNPAQAPHPLFAKYLEGANRLEKSYREVPSLSTALMWLGTEQRIRELCGCTEPDDFNVMAAFDQPVPTGEKVTLNIAQSVAEIAAHFAAQRHAYFDHQSPPGDLITVHSAGHA